MSFQGMIEDVAVADVMQLIRLGGHSGTLTVNNGHEEGFIGFERGRIVSAWNPRTRRVGELLVSAGAVEEGALVRALGVQTVERPRRSIGQILVRMGATTSEAIRDVMALEIERVVGEILYWKTGTFEFAIDDLTPMVEVTRFTGAPKVDLDAQTVLMDVLRRMADGEASQADEAALAAVAQEEAAKGAKTGPPTRSSEFEPPSFDGLNKTEARVVLSATSENLRAIEPSAHPNAPPSEGERMRFQIVSPDAELVVCLNKILASTGDRIFAVPLRDAGASLLGESPPIVVVDLRYQGNAQSTLSALCRSRPRAAVIALFGGRAPLREMYASGVLSVTSAVPETTGRRPARVRRSVVLPAPLGPWSSTISPGSTSRSTPASAGKRPSSETAERRWTTGSMGMTEGTWGRHGRPRWRPRWRPRVH